MRSSRIGRLEQTVKDTIIILKEKRLGRKMKSQTCHLVSNADCVRTLPSPWKPHPIWFHPKSFFSSTCLSGQVLLRKWGGTIWGSWKIPGYTGLQCGHKYPPITGLMTSVLCPPWPGAAGVLSVISCRNDRQRNVWTEEGPLRAFFLVMPFPLQLVQWLPAYLELGCSALMSQRGQESSHHHRSCAVSACHG